MRNLSNKDYNKILLQALKVMFESIIIRNQSTYGSQPSIDLGFLAEALIFYQKVIIVVQSNTLTELVEGVGPDTLLELLKQDFVTIKYLDKRPAIHTRGEVHTPLMVFSPDHTLDVIAPKVFKSVIGKSGKGRRSAKSFQSLVKSIAFEDKMAEELKNDFITSELTARLVKKILNSLTPEYKIPEKFKFEITEDKPGFQVETNLDFEEINKYYRKRIPQSHSTITKSFFLGQITYLKEEIKHASQHNSEIASSEYYSGLHQLIFENLINKFSADKIGHFQDFVFDDSRSIQNIINMKAKNFDDLLTILKRGEKFKEWLKGKPLDADLAKEYFKEVTASTWIDKLPGKSSRWSIFTGIGVGIDALGAGGLGTALGIGISAADSFLLDNILKGWKPDQFIDDSLREFVDDD